LRVDRGGECCVSRQPQWTIDSVLPLVFYCVATIARRGFRRSSAIVTPGSACRAIRSECRVRVPLVGASDAGQGRSRSNCEIVSSSDRQTPQSSSVSFRIRVNWGASPRDRSSIRRSNAKRTRDACRASNLPRRAARASCRCELLARIADAARSTRIAQRKLPDASCPTQPVRRSQFDAVSPTRRRATA